ncbi:protein of unknown function [Cyanobium sp. NIES-981]|nr:protein of unknown function [Cyanobium sp. NIES-981]
MSPGRQRAATQPERNFVTILRVL